MSAVPTIIVLTHVRPNSATLIQGNLCRCTCSNKISAGGLNELSMELLMLLPPAICPGAVLQRLQVFARFEPHGFSRRNIHFRARSGVPADAGLSWFDGKHAEA